MKLLNKLEVLKPQQGQNGIKPRKSGRILPDRTMSVQNAMGLSEAIRNPPRAAHIDPNTQKWAGLI